LTEVLVAKFVIILVDGNLSNINKQEQNSKEVADTLLSTEENIKHIIFILVLGKKFAKYNIFRFGILHKVCLLY
jgi:hypothetical protein